MHPEKISFSYFFLNGIFSIVMFFCLFGVSHADNWVARLYETASPGHVVGVDKKRQIFNLFEKKSPLKLKFSYPCVTGQLEGDKQQTNDLRTPEGIYFVEYKIASGLDFKEYGGVAYTLNYPNPVDRLRGKTGHGIWIHSKGFELVPTRGCVAIGLQNIAEVGPLLTAGTPVVLAQELNDTFVQDNKIPDTLRELMRQWTNAWASRSPALFDYYEPDSYSIATENFDTFRQNKERLFKILNFIKIFNRDIQVLEGPGYWVTWSEQLYTASNLSSEGVRRLYWQKNNKGKFKIVGMEWIPRDMGMRADLLKGRLVAEGPINRTSDASSEAPQAPRLDMPEEGVAVLPGISSKSDEAGQQQEKLVAIGDPLVPKKSAKPVKPDEINWDSGRMLNGPEDANENIERTATPQLVLPGRDTKQAKKDISPAKRIKNEPDIPGTKSISKDLTIAELTNIYHDWENAYRNRDEQLLEFYDKKNFNRMPANQGIIKRLSLNSLIKILKTDLDSPWLVVLSRTPKIESKGEIGNTESEIMLINAQGVRQGRQKIWWRKDEDGKLKIVGSDFTPTPVGLEGEYLESVSNDVTNTLEAWRKAWEAGDIDSYMSFYAPNAIQQNRMGERSIRKQKELLWSRIKPREVRLTGIRIAMDNRGLRADMNQLYSDKSGKTDKGVKTIYLGFNGQKWLIQREDWTASQAVPDEKSR